MTRPLQRVSAVLAVLAAVSAGTSLAAGQLPPPGPSRYLVTTAPVKIGEGGPTLCLGLDPALSAGLWWWEPGKTGCDSRSTAPDVFPAQRASVTVAADGTVRLAFQLGMHEGPPLEIALVVRDGMLLLLRPETPGSNRVPVRARDDLEFQLLPPG